MIYQILAYTWFFSISTSIFFFNSQQITDSLWNFEAAQGWTFVEVEHQTVKAEPKLWLQTMSLVQDHIYVLDNNTQCTQKRWA